MAGAFLLTFFYKVDLKVILFKALECDFFIWIPVIDPIEIFLLSTLLLVFCLTTPMNEVSSLKTWYLVDSLTI